MKCPFCGSTNTQVKDSRDTIDETAIRRRRECPDCGGRFTTYERVQLQDLTVVKRTANVFPSTAKSCCVPSASPSASAASQVLRLSAW